VKSDTISRCAREQLNHRVAHVEKSLALNCAKKKSEKNVRRKMSGKREQVVRMKSQ
jgi:hypothetical protein